MQTPDEPKLRGQETRPSDVDMQVVDKRGTPVDRRITAVAAARKIVTQMYDGYSTERLRRARLKGQADGNPPYSEARLTELNLGYVNNQNFLELRSALNDKKRIRFEAMYEVPALISVKPRKPVDTAMQTKDDGGIIAEGFTRIVKSWSGYLPFLLRSHGESDLYGHGVGLFADEYDWRPKAFNTSAFYADSMAELDVNTLQRFALRDKYTAGELWRAVKNAERAKALGWDRAAVLRLLVDVYVDKKQSTDDDKFQTSPIESMEQRLINNDPVFQDKEFEPVYVWHLFYQEIDGRVTHFIFPEKEISSPDGFLYARYSRFERMSKVLWWTTALDGDGYLRSCRGFASFLEPHCDLSNRFLCKAFDAGMTASTLLLQASDLNSMKNARLLRSGVMTVVPPGLNLQQASFQPPIVNLIQLRGVSSEIMRNNTNTYRRYEESFPENRSAQPPTARQVAEIAGKEARAEKADLAWELICLEALYKEMFFRLTNKEYIDSSADYPGKAEAQEFVGWCVDRGVDRNDLLDPKHWDVTITKPIGFGSWGVRMDVASKVMEAIGFFDEVGRINAVRDYLAVYVGHANVDRYKPLGNRNETPTNELTISDLENHDALQGSITSVGSDQLHYIHFGNHAKLIMQIIEQYKKSGGVGMDLARAHAALQAVLPHAERHLQYLSQEKGRDDIVKNGLELLKLGTQVMEAIKSDLVKLAKLQMNEQAQQQQVVAEAEAAKRDRELELMAQRMAGELRLKEENQRALAEVRMYTAQEKAALNRMRAAEDIRLKADEQAVSLDLLAEQVAAKIVASRKQ